MSDRVFQLSYRIKGARRYAMLSPAYSSINKSKSHEFTPTELYNRIKEMASSNLNYHDIKIREIHG